MRGLLYRTAFQTAARLQPADVRESIVIAGAPRSGTTMLLEVFRELPGYKALNEPLLRRAVREQHGFGYRTFLEPGQPAERQRAFLEHVLRGQASHEARWAFRNENRVGQIWEHASNRRMLVKFCRINRMLRWFDREFETRGIVLLIRHPCAVVSSMFEWGDWEKNPADTKDVPGSLLCLRGLPADLREVFDPVIASVRSRAESLAALWCLDHYIPLMYGDSYPWVLAPYERLVTRGRAELDRYSEALGMSVHPGMQQMLRQPSSSAKAELADDAGTQLSKWRQSLDPRDIDDILRVVDAVGLSSFYGDGVEPDYDLLDERQDPRFRWGPLPG